MISSCFAQNEKKSEAVYDIFINYRPSILTIWKGCDSIRTSAINANISAITYINADPGIYRVEISWPGQQTTINDSVVVMEGQNLTLNLRIDGPCLYDHPANYIPVCPKNHKDNILPIRYGLHGTVVRKGEKDGGNERNKPEAIYAGCVVTSCDPRFYCTEHDIKF